MAQKDWSIESEKMRNKMSLNCNRICQTGHALIELFNYANAIVCVCERLSSFSVDDLFHFFLGRIGPNAYICKHEHNGERTRSIKSEMKLHTKSHFFQFNFNHMRGMSFHVEVECYSLCCSLIYFFFFSFTLNFGETAIVVYDGAHNSVSKVIIYWRLHNEFLARLPIVCCLNYINLHTNSFLFWISESFVRSPICMLAYIFFSVESRTELFCSNFSSSTPPPRLRRVLYHHHHI